MAELSRIEGQVLRTVRFSPREESWQHPTLCQLRAFGFVVSDPIHDARTRSVTLRNRWTITPAGVAAYEAWR